MRNCWPIIFIFFISCSKFHAQNRPEVFAPNTMERKEKGYFAKGQKFAIATQGRFTSDAAKAMFDQGGNIADAAVAASFAISVERPQSTGIGGGGFLLYKKADQEMPQAWDFRERAPLLSHDKMYLDEKGKVLSRKSLDGIHAVAVPGLVKGLLEFHAKNGKLPIKKVIQPSIDLARNGFKVYPGLEKAIKARLDVINKHKDSKKIFTKNGEPLKAGDLLVQEDLAKTLELIASGGIKSFYEGDIARKILKTSNKLGGILQQADFKKYQVIRRAPVMRKFKDNIVYSMAPPSSGGIHVLQILGVIEKDNLKQYGPHHTKSMHITSAAMQAAFVDRAEHLGDPDYQEVPTEKLLSQAHIKSMRFSIPESTSLNKSSAGVNLPNEKYKLPHEKKHTTHISIIDSKGNVISTTQTINGLFGSAVVADGTGIVLNNEMDDFSAKKGAQNLFGAVGGSKNLIEPLKTPLSSMSPTIVFNEKKKQTLAVGSPNGTRIITCVALTLINRLEHDYPLYESVALARYHHQWMPDEIRLEEMDYPKRTEKELKFMGYELNKSNYTCRVQAVQNLDGQLSAVSDPRGEGKAFAE